MEEEIKVLKQLQKEMWSGDLECQDCPGSCCDCRRYNVIEKVINILESEE